MNFEITVNIKAPELVEAIRLISTIGINSVAAVTESKKEAKPEKDKQLKTVEKPKEDSKSEPIENSSEETEPEYIPTVVELREAAQEKGKTAEGKKAIKALLDKYDSKAISNVPEDKRAAFLVELEAL